MLVFDKTSFPPPLILAFCSSVHRYGPLHIYPCICNVAPCLRVLWMSTHGCFAPPFPLLSSFWLLQPDGGVQEPDATADGCCYVKIVDDQELLGGPRQEALPLRSCCFCASLLKASLFNLCMYSDIVASADSCVSTLYSIPRGPPWLVI